MSDIRKPGDAVGQVQQARDVLAKMRAAADASQPWLYEKSSRKGYYGAYVYSNDEAEYAIKVYDDPELWKAGEVKSIPTINGRQYPCRITRVLPAVIEFDGPTGPACITRSLYATLTKGEQ